MWRSRRTPLLLVWNWRLCRCGALSKDRDDHGDIVATASVVGFGDENSACELRILMSRERRRDLIVREHLRQAVRAQQNAIVGLQLERLRLDPDPGLLAADDV